MTYDSWAIQLQNAQPTEIAASPFDLVVVDRDRWDGTQSRAYTADEVAAMETASDGGDRDVFAYMSVAAASSTRDYWDPSWATQPPAWLGPADPAWSNSYFVQFWEADWQALLFGGPDAYLDRIIAAGFDGVFLDTVSLYHRYDDVAFADGSTAAEHMVALVADIAAYARTFDPAFKIYVNGGEDLLPEAAFMDAIDGISKESLHYGVPGLGEPNAADSVAYSSALLASARDAGKMVLNVEYLASEAAITDVQASNADSGFLSYFSPDQSLATLDYTGSGAGDAVAATGGPNHVSGLGGDDTLHGGAGHDSLDGGSGRDRLEGGLGKDVLAGGGGADVFRFGPGSGHDVIADYSVSAKGECIELASDLIPGVSGFKALKAALGEDDASNAVIHLVDGNTITLLGVNKAQLQANDFVFL